MKKNIRLDEEVEKTLHSLDGLDRASPKPFFLTRVEARLSRSIPAKAATAWVFRPAWVAASLGLIFLLNLSAVVYVRGQLLQQEDEPEAVGLSIDWEFDTDVLDW